MKLTDYSEKIFNHKVLLLGLPKTGKSTLAAELSKKYNLHWIDIEKGEQTLLRLPREQQERISLYSIPDSGSNPIAAVTLTVLFKFGKMNICLDHGAHDCKICKTAKPDTFSSLNLSELTSNDIVVLDSGTQLGRSILAHITRTKDVDYKPERDDWGSLRKFTEFFASQFQALRCNFICICHAVEAELEDSKKKLVPDFGSKGMSSTFAKAFDHVIYTDVKAGKHVAGSMTNYSPLILTGSRTDFDITKLPAPSLIPLFAGEYQSKPEATPGEKSLAAMAKLVGKV